MTRDGSDSRSVATSNRILDAAVQVLRAKGFPATRIADVAAAAGVSQGLVVYHFKSKERLLCAALRFAEERFQADAWTATQRMDDPGERLDLLIRLNFRQDGTADLAPSWVLWPDLWQQAVRNDDVRRDWAEIERRSREAIARIVIDGQALGRFGSADADLFARMLAALCDGLAMSLIMRATPGEVEEAVELCRRLCRAELGDDWLAQPPSRSHGARRRSANSID